MDASDGDLVVRRRSVDKARCKDLRLRYTRRKMLKKRPKSMSTGKPM